MTPDFARKRIAQLQAKLTALAQEAADAGKELEMLRTYLTSVEQISTVTGMRRRKPKKLTETHKRNISAGMTGGDPFLRHIRTCEGKYTLRSLAAEIKCSPSVLSMNRQAEPDKNGRTYPVPRDRAEQIERLTGWPADAAHWPAGISS